MAIACAKKSYGEKMPRNALVLVPPPGQDTTYLRITQSHRATSKTKTNQTDGRTTQTTWLPLRLSWPCQLPPWQPSRRPRPRPAGPSAAKKKNVHLRTLKSSAQGAGMGRLLLKRNLVKIAITFRWGTWKLKLLQLQLRLYKFGFRRNLVPDTVPK